MSDCIFCKIVKGEIPSYKLYEDENTLAFLDLSNDGNGHILVIPKKHCRNILDCEETDLACVFKTIQKVSRHLVEKCGFDGVNILNANEQSGEQSVFHLHFHVLPRKEGDEMKVFPNLHKCKYSNQELCDMLRIEE